MRSNHLQHSFTHFNALIDNLQKLFDKALTGYDSKKGFINYGHEII